MHNSESRFVTGPSNILFSGVYVCIFNPEILQAGEVMGLSPLKRAQCLKRKHFKKRKRRSYFKMLVAKTAGLQISRAAGSSHGPYIGPWF